MFQKTYKFIGMIIVMVILLGHHSFQAHAIETASHHTEEISCIGHDCHHQAKMEICAKIQGDEMQIITGFLLLPENSHCIFTDNNQVIVPPNEVYQKYRE